MNRQRGLTLVEVLIALVLGSIMSAFLLMLTRGQLLAYGMNEQIVRTQQNLRAGVSFLEATLRRACGGLQWGRVGIAVGATSALRSCLQVYDGAAESGGSFTAGATGTNADAVEIITGVMPVTRTTAANVTVAGASVTVTDSRGFSVGDLVLVTDFRQGVIFRIASIAPTGTVYPGGMTEATFTFDNGAVPLIPGVGAGGPAPSADLTTPAVMRAESIAIYRSTATTGPFAGALMLDPDGALGNDHSDAEPLVEVVEDFQLAVGRDQNGNGIVGPTAADPLNEWEGDATGELPLVAPTVAAWNQPTAGVQPQYRSVRATVVARTEARYAGATPPLGPFENRTTYPSTAGGGPRYRFSTITVAPRSWNLTN